MANPLCSRRQEFHNRISQFVSAIVRELKLRNFEYVRTNVVELFGRKWEGYERPPAFLTKEAAPARQGETVFGSEPRRGLFGKSRL